MKAPPALRYLVGYPDEVVTQARAALEAGRVLPALAQRYPEAHAVRTDRALYEWVMAMKNRHLRQSVPLQKAVYDPSLQLVHQALGTHTAVSRVQGGQLKAKREIRIAALFKDAPEAFLRMIVVHELAHLKEREHGRAFYALCRHMEPDYHQLEFDLRLWLAARELAG